MWFKSNKRRSAMYRSRSKLFRICFEKSPRNVNLQDIKALSRYDKKNSSFVAVTVDPSDQFIKKNLLGNFEYIQLHGSETRERANEIKNMGFKIIKAIKIKEERDIENYKKFTETNIILLIPRVWKNR